MPPTHEVFNQPPALTGYDVADDPAMLAALRREGAGWAEDERPRARPPGRLGAGPGAGPAGQREPAGAAHPRPLRAPDRRGGVPPGLARADDDRGRHGLHAAPWRDGRPGAHVARAAGFYVWGAGRGRALLPDLDDLRRRARAARTRPDLAAQLRAAARGPGATTSACGRRETKRGLLAGMSMTEKQGGSDVRANTTRAVAGRRRQLPADRPQVVHLGADVRPVPGAGPGARRACPASCCPRVLPDGTRNAMRLQRLKDKLGNRSNASAEVEYDDALGLAGRRGGPRRAAPSSRWST